MDQSDSRRSEVAEEAKADFEQKILYQKSYLDVSSLQLQLSIYSNLTTVMRQSINLDTHINVQLLFDDHLSIYLKGLAQQQFTAKQGSYNFTFSILYLLVSPLLH